MFCPNCTQSFDGRGLHECPTCGFNLTRRIAKAPADADDQSQQESNANSAVDTSKMDAGVRRGVKLVLIAVAFFPVYKVLAWLYPANDFLISGTRSVELFETAGRAVLFLLFGGGILRVLYAVTVERRKTLQSTTD